MGTLFIAELMDNVGLPDVMPVPVPVEQKVAIGPASVQSAPFQEWPKFVRLWATDDCNIAFGDNPVATPNSCPITARTGVAAAVTKGMKIAVKAFVAPGTDEHPATFPADWPGRDEPAPAAEEE